MKYKKVFGTFFIIIILTFCLAGCSKTSVLRLNVKKGEKYRVTVATDQKITLNTSNQNEVTSVNSVIPNMQINKVLTTAYIYNIEDVDNSGTATVKVSYDFINMKISGGGQTSEVDTRKSEFKNTPDGKAYSEMLKNSFTLKINKDGKVKDITGVNEMIDKSLSSIELNDTDKKTLSTLLKENFGEEAIKGIFNSITDVYPSKEIKEGTSWKTEQKVNYGIPMTVSTNWKIVNIKNEIVNVDTNSNVNADSSDTLNVMGIKINYNIKGIQKGNVKINQNNGIMQNGDYRQNLSGIVDIIIPKSSTTAEQKVTTPVKIDGTIKYETEKIK